MVMKVRSLIIILVAVLAYSIPVTTILYLSDKEIKKYAEDANFDFREVAYGAAEKVIRQDVEETYDFDLNVTCTTESVKELSENAQIKVSEMDELFKGEIIATLNGTDIVADENGIVTRVEYAGDKQYIYYHSFNALVFECMVPEKYEYLFESEYLYNEKNEKINIISKSNINEEGYYRVYLSIPDDEAYDYGETVSGYQLCTGNIYKETLVVRKDCVYNGDDGEYHVRIIDEKGNFIEEKVVEIGYSYGEYVCVTGVEEGQLCDSGYKSLNDNNEDEANEIE